MSRNTDLRRLALERLDQPAHFASSEIRRRSETLNFSQVRPWNSAGQELSGVDSIRYVSKPEIEPD